MLFFVTRVDTRLTGGTIDLHNISDAAVYLLGEWRVCETYTAPESDLWNGARTAAINRSDVVLNDTPHYSLQATIKNRGTKTDSLMLYHINYVSRIYVNNAVVYDIDDGNASGPDYVALNDITDDTLTITLWMTGSQGVQNLLRPLVLILTSENSAYNLSSMRIAFKYVMIGIYLAYALVCLMMYLKNKSAIHFLLLSLSGLIRMLALESYLAPQLLAEWLHLPGVWTIRFAMLFIAMASTLNAGVIYILFKRYLFKKLTLTALIVVNVVLLLALISPHGDLALLLNASGYLLYLLCLIAVGRAWINRSKSAGYMFIAFLSYMVSLLFFYGSRTMAGLGSTLGVYNFFSSAGEFIFFGVTVLAFFVRYIESYFQNLSQIRSLDTQLSDKERSLSDAYDKLRQFEAARTRMLRDLTHDLRTPITSVLGYLSMMSSGEITNEQVVRSISGKMLMRVRQIRDMTNSLSSLMTLEQGDLKMQTESCPVANIMHAVETHYGQKCREAGLIFALHRHSDQFVLVDIPQIMRVFDNLIGNAIRYTPKGGVITISAEDTENIVQFSVRDSGIGIPKDQQSYIFGRFYRGEQSRTDSGAHQGLGLAICFEIIKAHNGSIGVISDNGKGSEFYFSLPQTTKG